MEKNYKDLMTETKEVCRNHLSKNDMKLPEEILELMTYLVYGIKEIYKCSSFEQALSILDKFCMNYATSYSLALADKILKEKDKFSSGQKNIVPEKKQILN